MYAFVFLTKNAYAYVRILRTRSVNCEPSDMTWKEWQNDKVKEVVRVEAGRLVYRGNGHKREGNAALHDLAVSIFINKHPVAGPGVC